MIEKSSDNETFNQSNNSDQVIEDFLNLLLSLQEDKEDILTETQITFTNKENKKTDSISQNEEENLLIKQLPVEESTEILTKETSEIESLNPDLKQIITELQNQVNNTQANMNELADNINALLPIISEILLYKSEKINSNILETIVPMIDEIIYRRHQENSEKMANALADILPPAIKAEIRRTPRAIAESLAPEVALAMEAQIRLDSDSISKTLGPEMGKAIKEQIELEKDAMIDALYPVIGSTISKYMIELVQSINDKVENALSFEGIKRKIRAKLQGISEAELILKEVNKYQVQAIFLIHKNSGLVIAESQTNLEQQLEADMLAGMLTAMQSFVHEYIAQAESNSELNEIEYSGSKIIIEVAGYCYLAVIVKGEPTKQFLAEIRQTLSHIILKFPEQIKYYDGDRTLIAKEIPAKLKHLMDFPSEPESSKKKPLTLIILLIGIIGIIFTAWGYARYRIYRANKIENQVALSLSATPELSVYRLTPKVEKNTLYLEGKLPNKLYQSKAEQIAAKIAQENNLKLQSKLIAVQLPPDPTVIAEEISLLTQVLEQSENIKLTTFYQHPNLIIETPEEDSSKINRIKNNFQLIPGIKTIIINRTNIPTIPHKIFFASNSAQLNSARNQAQIATIVKILQQNPHIHLRVIGSTDPQGSENLNKKLAQQRAEVVIKELVKQKIDPNRLHPITKPSSNVDLNASDPLLLSKYRYVEFEAFIP